MSTNQQFDLIIIGGGPAGYVAAIRAAQLGLKTACIEKREGKALGGTCLNVGCIPSKALLESSEHYHQAKHKFAKHGIVIGDLGVDLEAMMKRKETIVRQLTNGIAGLFKKHGVTPFYGHGTLQGNSGEWKRVGVSGGESGPVTLEAKKILLATGSEASELPFMKFDGKRILSSTEALSLKEIPRHLVVVGGGVIGLEMGSVWARLGARVTVIEFQDRILPGMDKQTGDELKKALLKQGFEFKFKHKCLGAKETPGGLVIEAEDMTQGQKIALECDYVLVSTGRRPYTAKLGLDTVGITPDQMGRIPIDEHFQTAVPGIYAVGDIVDGPMLAHKAEEEGVAAVEIIAGQPGHVNYEAIPNVVYTWPEVASVGYTEEEVKNAGVECNIGVFPFMANARAKTMEETEGFVKIIADKKTDRVLGAHIVGPRASDILSEIVSVIEFGGSSEDIARTCHAHPTLSEVVKEAALAVEKRQRNL